MWWFSWLVAAAWLTPAALGSLDSEMVNALQESLDSDQFVITVKQLKPRRVVRQDIETLFALQGMADAVFAIKLDRVSKKVIIETRRDKKAIKVPSLTENRVISSLVLYIEQTKSTTDVSLYVDCNKEGKISLSESLKQTFDRTTNPLLKVYRERKYVTDLDSDTDVQEVLKSLKCAVSEQMLSTQPQPANETPEEESTFHRADIPIYNECDDSYLLKTINQLISVVKKLQDELEAQRIETRNLRQLLEQCDICRPGEGY